MESHVLNSYHQARYQTIGHKLLRTQAKGTGQSNDGYAQRWDKHWSRNQTINMTRSQDTSSDEDENIEVQELTYDDRSESIPPETAEEQILVEGDDYDVIQVYAVDPNIDMEASDDDDQEDFCVGNNIRTITINTSQEDADEYLTVLNRQRKNSESQSMEGLNFNLDSPVVSNVDEYFIKEDKDKDILAVKDEPVVNDVDEYFIKEERPITSNVDDFLIKVKQSDELEVPKTVNVDDFFVSHTKPPETVVQTTTDQNVGTDVDNTYGVPINESDLEVLPNIEDLKRFLLEDMSYSKFKNAQRSCSLPQSPMHNLCLDIDDAKTCLSFEDLNLDLSDLSFDNVRNKSGSSNKSEDIPRTLTEEDVNSFLITDKPKFEAISLPPIINEDDLSQQDMEIEHTVESLIDPIVIPKIEAMIKIPEKTSKPVKSTVHTADYSVEPTDIPKIQTPIIIPETRTFTPIKSMVLHTLESSIDPIVIPKNEKPDLKTPTPIKSTVLNFCIEKSSIKKEPLEIKPDPEELVDVESCNDTVIPVLEANNLNSLLEQFEATENLNSKPKRVKNEEPKVKSVDIKVKCADFKVKSSDVKVKSVLSNGMRLQDAGVQLNKTKMRQILMPSTINASMRRSPSPVHSDHDYCSSKKRFSLPNIKGGQSLLKPEVLSSNNKILSSRHRSCKNKKIVYALSSDDESDKNKNLKLSDNSDIKVKKCSVKQTEKAIAQTTRKKLSPVHSAHIAHSAPESKDKSNSSVIVKDACKASDTPFSQNSNGSIKLTIKNKSEVILNCDVKDSQKDKPIEKYKPSASEKTEAKKVEIQNNIKNNSVLKNIKEVDSNKKSVVSVEGSNTIIKEEPRPKSDNFYTALFSNKQDVQIPQTIQIKSEKRSFEEEISIVTKPNKDSEQPQKKRKLNLQEYKMRRNASSNNSSAQVSPEPIFFDMPIQFSTNKIRKYTPNQTPPNGVAIPIEQNIDATKKIFDPIREASRKILMNTKKQKAEAMRKRDEDIVMSKIPKVENLELQPLISDAEMMKIAGMIPNKTVPVPISEKPIGKPQMPTNIEEIVMVSIGINTDDTIFKELRSTCQSHSQSPTDSKSAINFKIKKSEVSKQNVFNSVKCDKKSPTNEKKSDTKIDRERFKDITKTLKKVERQVDTKMYSNSLFSSIQDTVMKKAPNESSERKRSKSNSPKRKAPMIKATIIRDYDTTADHGEDKIILHLVKNRKKPQTTSNIAQTDADPKFGKLTTLPVEVEVKGTSNRKRNDSDMSMSSESSPIRKESPKTVERKERRTRSPSKEKRSRSKERRTRSRDRYEKYRRTRSRTRSRSRRRRRSHSRSRSRSRGRFRRYRRSDSPYRRKRRSRTRSPYRRRSPSPRRETLYGSKSHERSRSRNARSKTPRKKSPPRMDRKSPKSLTPPPPPRKPTVSESSESSSSSSSSSSTSSSDGSRQSSSLRRSATPRRSTSPYGRDGYRKKYRSYSSEDRDSNTPVEERRIVFVGKLEAEASKASLRAQFSKFGHVLEVRLHTKEDGSRYGFVTYAHARDAWSAVEAGPSFPHYDVGFGGRRAFCRQSYADLDGLEAKYTESVFHGTATLPARRSDDMSFEQMLHDMRRKLQQRKGEKRTDQP